MEQPPFFASSIVRVKPKPRQTAAGQALLAGAGFIGMADRLGFSISKIFDSKAGQGLQRIFCLISA